MMRYWPVLLLLMVGLGGCKPSPPPFEGQTQVVTTTVALWDGVERAMAFERAHDESGTQNSAAWGVPPDRRAELDAEANESMTHCEPIARDHPVCSHFWDAISAWRAEEAPVTWAEHH
jgi:hypothetical protein